MRRLTSFRNVTAAALIAIAVGCSSSSGADANNDDNGGITVTSSLGSTPTLSVAIGTSGSIPITITRTGGYSGAVTFSASGLPTGVTVPAQTVGVEPTVNIAFQVSGNATPGTYPVTVSASGPGIVTRSLAATLNLTGRGSFTLTAAPATVTLNGTNPVTTSIRYTPQDNFSNLVTFSAAPPAGSGIQVTFDHAIAENLRSTATITAPANLPSGRYDVVFTGSSPGVQSQTVTVGVVKP